MAERCSRILADENLDCVVVGGCGHIGLPIALLLVDIGRHVGIFDTDLAKVRLVSSGRMPFHERGCDDLLAQAIQSGRLVISERPEIAERTDVVISVIGTPIDEFLNPSMHRFDQVIDQLAPHLRTNALIILMSTVFPGTTDYLVDCLRTHGAEVEAVFCPERVVGGNVLEEMRTIPQIIGVSSDSVFNRACAVFEEVSANIVRTSIREAELAKLMSNAWRYMKFAIANEFFQIAHRAGLDYSRVLNAVRTDYPRAADLPAPGLTSGPRLLKDTMQLAAFVPDMFPMGHAAMLVNEGLPAYIVDELHRRQLLSGRTVGILGMAFKGDSDDSRNSLSYKLIKLLGFKGARVLCSDPYVSDPQLVSLERVVSESDVVILGAPHAVYRHIRLGDCHVVDVWALRGHGIQL